jgi:hypothetical protein
MVSESLNIKLFNTFHSTCHSDGARFDKVSASSTNTQRRSWRPKGVLEHFEDSSPLKEHQRLRMTGG